MIGRGLFILAILSNCVLSLPVTSSQLENEDVKVMKCIVEVLADVLSRPHEMPVSKDCLVTLKTDDRLVKILRHQKFLKELQEIAVQGNHKRAQLQREHATPTTLTQTLPTADDMADRSMLEAFGGPGERSILSQTKRTGNGDAMEEKNDSREDGESQEDDGVEESQPKRGNDDEAENKEEKESEEKRANSGEENVTKDEPGDEQSDGQRQKKEKNPGEDDKDEEDQTSTLVSHINEKDTEEEVKRRSRENIKRWTKSAKSLSVKRKAASEDAQRDAPHHSKEVTEDDEEEKKRDSERSPEERELQWIARRAPEERKEVEEEGSASRKSEEPEIESLAAIESELENVAQKLHELRRG